MSLRRFTCPLCGHPAGLEVRLDRKGRPFATCAACFARTFLRSRESLAGLLGLSALLDDAPELKPQVLARGSAAVDAWTRANRASSAVGETTASPSAAEDVTPHALKSR